MTASPELILFAIRSTIKLGRQIRRAYVDSLKREELVLPLPDFPRKVDTTSALNYFEGNGTKHAEEVPGIAELLEKAQAQTLNDKEKDEFCLFHQEMKAIDMAEEGRFIEEGIMAKEMVALCTVRQWSRGSDPNPTALRRMAGTLIEVAVDYYADVPGALNEKSAYSKLLKGFFVAIDDKDFVNTPVVDMAEDLFVATIETIGKNPVLLTGDDKTQLLVESVAKSIAEDAQKRIEKIREAGGDLSAEERVRFWTQLIYRSVLSNAGETVLANPEKFLKVRQGGKSELVTSVGSAILDIVTDENEMEIEALFSHHTLDKVIKAALSVLATHPELIEKDEEGLKKIISQVAKGLSASSQKIGPDILPEVMRLVLEKTSHNLELVWPGHVTDPKEHLLIVAVGEVMDILSETPKDDAVWIPKLNQQDIIEILEVVLDEVIQSPDWLLKEVGESSIMSQALEGALDAMKKIPKGRLSSQTAKKVLKSALRAVALRKDFLKKVPTPDSTQGKYLVTLSLGSVFDVLLGNRTHAETRWVSSRGTVVGIVVDSVLNKLAVDGVSEQSIEKLKQVLEIVLSRLSEGKRFSLEELEEEITKVEI